MGKRGPQPKLAEIKRLTGNPGHRPIKKGISATGSATAPDHLEPYAAEVWDRIRSSMPPALYAAADRELLAAYCTAADLHRQSVLALREAGHIAYGDKGAPYQNPWVSIQSKQAQLLASLGARLGLDPAARESLSAPSGQDQRPSKFEGLTAIPGGKAP